MTVTSRPSRRWLSPAILGAATLAGSLVFAPQANAQVFGPPSTFFGSVTDADGPVPAGVPVEAYVGDTLCGSKGQTELVGEGEGQVTAYAIDVDSREQTAGCGAEGVEVRIKIGDRFAEQTGMWEAGPVQVDVVFGDATPAAIPTFTPAPTRTPTPPPAPGATGTPATGTTGTPAATGTPDSNETAATGTIPAGSPGAGSPVPTRPGGLVTSGPGASGGGGGDDGGMPVWAIVGLVLGGVAAIGGGVGFAMSRTRHGPVDEEAELAE